MNCIVIDDEPLARQGMEMYIAQVSSIQLKGSFSSAIAASNYIRNNVVDLMFLDINMPELSGLDFLKSLKESPLVIFTTAYPQYALESYELDAIDYLVKPIRIERFLKAVLKAENHYRLLHQESTQIEKIEEDFVFIKSDRKYFKIHFKDILYIEGLKDYAVIYTADGNKFIASMNIKTIASQLPAVLFGRVSKSYIVNVTHISSFDNELIYIQNYEIPLGEIYREEFIRQHVERKIVKR